MNVGVFDALRDYEGGWSCQRFVTMVVCLSVVGMWVWGCVHEGRFIHLGWEEISLLVGSQGAKAWQMKYEMDGREGENGGEDAL